MNNLIKILSVAAVLAPGAAIAADPYVGGSYDWSGFYAGVGIAAASGRTENTDIVLTTSGALIGIGPGAVTDYPGADSIDEPSGWLGTIQVGHNWQSGKLVFGLEAALNVGSVSATSSTLGSVEGPLYEGDASLDAYGTLGLRAGVAMDNLLVFATAGLAIGKGSATVAITPGIPPSMAEPFVASDSQTHVGYALGLGAEVGLSGPWTLRADYQYVNLGQADYLFEYAGSDGSTLAVTAATSVHVGKVSLNYRF
jgi:outer membrane immunogenic protein